MSCLALSVFRRRSVTLRELQSWIGLLNFCCSVVVPGRAFLRRLIDLTMGPLHPHHHIRLCKEAKLDIRMWLQFLQEFNGRAIFSFGSSRPQRVRGDICAALVLWLLSWKVAPPQYYCSWGPNEKAGLDSGLDFGLDSGLTVIDL